MCKLFLICGLVFPPKTEIFSNNIFLGEAVKAVMVLLTKSSSKLDLKTQNVTLAMVQRWLILKYFFL